MAFRQVAVFGGSGFLGRYVVQRLARSGARVVVAVRHTDSAQFLRPLGDVGQVAPVPCDISRPESVAAAVLGADAVVNLVGILFERGRQTFDDIHHKGAATVAAAARAVGAKRLVHVSAIGADASSPSTYARSKGLGEQAVQLAFPEATLLRPSIVFGPEDDFFNRFARLARLSPVLPLFGGGTTRFQPVYVGDVADAVMAGLNDKTARGRTYELGGPSVLTFEEILKLILAETNRCRCLMRLPFWTADMLGMLAPILPRLPGQPPMITRDQARLLRSDSVVTAGVPGLKELGVTPTALELVLPTYLDKYRRRSLI